MKIVPAVPSLIVLIGPSGAGKSTFAAKHFEAREVVSSDSLREELTGSFLRQDKNAEVFAEFHRRIDAKLRAGQRVVADATHLKNADRRKTAFIGSKVGVPVIYMIVNRSVEAKIHTGGWRTDIYIKGGIGLIEAHEQTFIANKNEILNGDGIATTVIDTRVDEYCVLHRFPVDPPNVIPFLKEQGFEKVRVIGDVHGNASGLEKAIEANQETFFLFLGDVLDYGSESLEAIRMVYELVASGKAIMIRGNHEAKILRFVLQERNDGFRGKLSHGNTATTNRLKVLSPKERKDWEDMFINLMEMSPDLIQIGDRWMFTHGGVHKHAWSSGTFRANRNSALESYSLYGETTGEFVDGYPVRSYNWVDDLPENTTAVVGHAILSTEEPVVMHGAKGGRAIFLDTGSSKDKDGVPGHLSWLDLDINVNPCKLTIRDYGRE